MILVDSSVWIDHLRKDDPALSKLLHKRQVLTHPFVIGELALGSIRQRDIVLDALRGLPKALVANDKEVHGFIDQHSLFGIGIGYIDAHLLAGTLLSVGARLWTRDKQLRNAALRLGLDAAQDH
ncbi:VapC toxin family PIN domain ribonuclease [Sphingobium sp. SCG-1]|uniref:type II toxin-antitoxin system VapC family toxin n=1 Tax=Sphingobium sp. SCG-1 TaxID=2072936 RepID=UPI000CD698FC|nr:type II toxin-antitoxin system VapC family toxin [Sphingobium sp. SCG-1]AUW56893.1 VapC toxin family PIN domain ribonuclease [Sphingobium sp. SCG-1]